MATPITPTPVATAAPIQTNASGQPINAQGMTVQQMSAAAGPKDYSIGPTAWGNLQKQYTAYQLGQATTRDANGNISWNPNVHIEDTPRSAPVTQGTVTSPVGGSGTSLEAPKTTTSTFMTDTSMPDKLAAAKQANFDLYQKQLSDATTKASTDEYSTSIKSLADQVRSNLTQTFTPDKQKQNKTDLLAKQDEIRQFGLDTLHAKSSVDFNNNLLTTQGNLSKAQIDRESAFKSMALSNEESNLLSKVNLSSQERTDLINGTKTLVDYQDKIQSHIDNAKQEVITAAKDLTTQQQTQLATAIDAYKGIDPEELSPAQSAAFGKIIMDAGLDPEVVFKGIQAVNDQQTFDNSIKSAAKTPNIQVIGTHYNSDAGTMVNDYGYVDANGKVVTTSGKPYTGSSSSTSSDNGTGNSSVDVSSATVDQVADAIKQVESGGNASVSGASGENGAFQFMPATWSIISQQYAKANGVNQSLAMTPANEDMVARWKIGQLLSAGNTSEQVAKIWNGSLGGSEQAVTKKGVNSKGVAYDTQAYADKVMNVLRKNIGPSESDNNLSPIQLIARGIINGNQPPVLTGLYGKGAAVRAELEKQGYNLTDATSDWTALQKYTATMNGSKILSLRASAQTAMDSLDLITQFSNQLESQVPRDKFPILNRAAIASAKNGLFGQDAQNTATMLDQQISEITSELATVYKGGNGATDDALKLGATQLSSNWDKKLLDAAVKNVRANLQIRVNSYKNLGPATADGSGAGSTSDTNVDLSQFDK